MTRSWILGILADCKKSQVLLTFLIYKGVSGNRLHPNLIVGYHTVVLFVLPFYDVYLPFQTHPPVLRALIVKFGMFLFTSVVFSVKLHKCWSCSINQGFVWVIYARRRDVFITYISREGWKCGMVNFQVLNTWKRRVFPFQTFLRWKKKPALRVDSLPISSAQGSAFIDAGSKKRIPLILTGAGDENGGENTIKHWDSLISLVEVAHDVICSKESSGAELNRCRVLLQVKCDIQQVMRSLKKWEYPTVNENGYTYIYTY